MHGYVLVVWKPLTQSILWTGQGKAKFLKQESRTWTVEGESENFGPLPLKYQWIRLVSSLSQ